MFMYTVRSVYDWAEYTLAQTLHCDVIELIHVLISSVYKNTHLLMTRTQMPTNATAITRNIKTPTTAVYVRH